MSPHVACDHCSPIGRAIVDYNHFVHKRRYFSEHFADSNFLIETGNDSRDAKIFVHLLVLRLEITLTHSPPRKEGWRDSLIEAGAPGAKREPVRAKPQLMVSRAKCFGRSDHPVCATSVASSHFLI